MMGGMFLALQAAFGGPSVGSNKPTAQPLLLPGQGATDGASTPRPVIVRVQGLHKEYGSTVALHGLDLEIEAGGVVGILGPNGAGKTTLVEVLEGLREPTRGSVSVLGLNPVLQSRDLKGRIGVQLQSTSLPAELTAAEMLALFASFYERSLPADEVFERVGLLGSASVRVGHLSGGQKQRLVLAIALVHDPALILLDEPTSGLDPAARRALHEVIRGLRSLGRTTILTTHYIEEAEELCDRVLIMSRGKVVADGTPFELVGRSGGSSTLWIAVDGELDPTALIAAGARWEGRQGEHHKLITTDPNAAVLVLGDMLRSQGLQLQDLRLKRPTLEDVYLELVESDGEAAGDVPHAASGGRS